MKEEIRQLLSEKELDAILLSDGYNMRYVSGFCGGEGYVYLTARRQILLTDSRYTTQAAEEAADFQVEEISGSTGYSARIAALMREDGVKRIGFEDRQMVCAAFENLKAGGYAAAWIPLGESVNALRCIKAQWELVRIAKAEEIGDRAFAKILNDIKPGVTELSIAAKLDYYMRELGAEGNSFDTIAASGVHSAMPHAIPTEKKLEKGDLLTLDFGCRYKGYCSDMTRTVSVGKTGVRQKEIYQIVLTAQEAALGELCAKKTGAEVDRAARSVIEKAGYGAYFGHGLGHSVGLFIHEEPRLSPKCHTVLRANTAMTVEPGIYLPGEFGVRIEDLAVIGESGCQNLTHSPKELIEL